MTITDILTDNIAYIIGHSPDKHEFRKFMDGLHDFFCDKINEKASNPRSKIFFSDIEMQLRTTCREDFLSCAECGECWLPEDFNRGKGQCLRCAPHFDPDLERELWGE